ncbi:MAG: DUF72 domain-containing protein [Chitinophagaceae bacterium]|nr:MAG: DUF72 domain-containing protein [Chitinophagaceae bacterium]
MATKRLHIGTSGWSYKHWRELIYPKGVKAADWLRFYAGQFDTAEVNRSFYSLPKPEVIAGWAAAVPPGFVFCPKLSRFLTHMKKLRDPEEPLERFFNTFAPLPAEQFGPVLVQLPPMLGFNPATAKHFYEVLLQRYPAHAFVVEVRHDSWYRTESLDLMRAYGIGLVIAESGGHFPYLEAVTSEEVYLRFHGPAALYASSYSDEQLQYYAALCRGWLGEGKRVWAFFNNDIHGYAWSDALRFKKILEGTGGL